MSVEDGVYYNELLVLYGKLLTDKHKAVAEAYFGLDLSLGEIAELNGISRQSVADALSAVKRKLTDYEDKLGLFALKNALRQALSVSDSKKAVEEIKSLLGEI